MRAAGRTARVPGQLPFSAWIDIALRIVRKLSSHNIVLIAAGVAFYGLLSFFPTVTAGVALLGLILDPETLVQQSAWFLELLPEGAREIILGQLDEVAGAGTTSLEVAALVALGVALWSASAAMGSLITGLNLVYEENEKRGFFRVKLLTIAMTMAMVFGLALMVTVIAAVPAILAIIGSAAADFTLILRWPLMFLLGVGGIAFLYRFGPSRRAAKWRWITPGAFVACALWVAGTIGFSFYVQSFGNYNETFGALAGVIILLTWMWISALIVLLGGLIDAEIEAQTARDTTVGPPRPRGERGAVKADILGETRST